MTLTLEWPSLDRLAAYADALRRDWSPDNVRGADAAREQLAAIEVDPQAFIAAQVDRMAAGDAITLLDGTTVPRLPGYVKWIWDGEFCGVIGFRWQPGTESLPPTCLGHIGYAVVPWKRGRGCATGALAGILPEARAEGLRYVELTTQPWNHASQRVIQANGGVFVEEFVTPVPLGGQPEWRYRIDLMRKAPAPADRSSG
jgi:predicted acetyltransferase